MRTVSAGELTALLAAHQNHYARVEVKDSTGAWRDLSDLEGRDWVESFSITCESIDQPVDQATVNLRREGPVGLSLAPFMSASAPNLIAAVYSPLLDYGVPIRISAAVLEPGQVVSGDTTLEAEDGEELQAEDDAVLELESEVGSAFRELFSGRIDRVAWQQDPIVLSCSSDAAWLMDTQIEAIDRYGSSAGTALETVLQELLDAWPSFLGAITLSTPVSPGWLLHEYQQDRVKLLEAMRTLALQIGWELRFRYDASDVNRLTLFEPDRADVTPLQSFAATQYEEVSAIDVALENIRNVARVPYYDVAGDPQFEEASDATSIARLGRRYIEVQESSASNIDTDVEALALAQAIVHDLSSPPVNHEKVLPLWWPVQFGDVYEFLANGIHYDEDQIGAVVGARHDFRGGEGKTTLQLRGQVSGAYREWLRREVGGAPVVVKPTLQVTMKLTATTAVFTWSGGPTVMVSINGAEPVTPPASPFVVARNPNGGESKTYGFIAFIVRGRADQLSPPSMVVPPQAASTASDPAITNITATNATFPGDGGGSVDIAWSEANLPVGFTIDLTYEITDGQTPSTDPTGQRLNIGSSPYTLNVPLGPDNPGGIITLTVKDGSEVVTTGQFDGLFAF